MPRRPSAWVLNLDAEYELASPDAHTSSAGTLRRLPDLERALAPLFGPDDVVVGEDGELHGARGRSIGGAGVHGAAKGAWIGRAWCPTPRALQRLIEAGAAPTPAPELAVLRRVNHRRFNAELGQTLPGARFVTRLEDLHAVIAGDSASGHWLLKRPFGFAGRGRRRVARGRLDASVATWVDASFRSGDGLQVEPWVDRIADYGLHGFLSQNGSITFGEPTRQTCDETGAWRGTALASDLESKEHASLGAEARAAAEALLAAGYFGPFGIDAYRWRDDATIHFNPRSEINARYAMGWAIGMQRCRVDLD
jgi:hypothetical protein